MQQSAKLQVTVFMMQFQSSVNYLHLIKRGTCFSSLSDERGVEHIEVGA